MDAYTRKSLYRCILTGENPNVGAPEQELVRERFGLPIVVTGALRAQAGIDDIPDFVHCPSKLSISPEAITACIARAQSEIGSLRERAKICAQEFSVENGPDRCVDAIESLFANGDSKST